MQLIPTVQTTASDIRAPEQMFQQENGDASKPPILLQYWYIAMRWRWVIAGVIVSCVLLGLIATLLMSPKYTAQAQLEISREQKQITKVEGVESEQAGRDLEFYATQYALLRTRPLAERVANTLHLGSNREFFAANGLPKIVDDPRYKGNTEKLKNLAIDILLAKVSIQPVRSSRLVYVSYTSRSPTMSALIANTWARSFITISMDRQLSSTVDARRFLLNQLESLRLKLEQSERQAVLYASQQDIVLLDQEKNAEGRTVGARSLAASNLQALNEALNRATEARIVAEARATSDASTAPEAITNQSLGLLRQQRAEAASQYAQLLVRFEPAYPAAQELAQKIKSIDQTIAREVARIGKSRSQDYREAIGRENELRAQVDALKTRLDAQQRASIQYAIYQREADTNRQLYDALLQRYKEIGIAGTVASSNIMVVEPAQVPGKPSSPRLLVNLVLSFFVGVFAAGIVTYGLEQIDEGVRDPSQVPNKLGLSLLGYTPIVDGSLQQELGDTKSAFYEAYFSVRSNLAFATSHGFPKTLMITSTRPGEGKSSTSVALAVILGRTGKRVLLIDADMRSPSLHALVERDNEAGLSNILAGEDNWAGLLQSSNHMNMDVLTAGPIPPSAAELLTGDRLDHLLADALGKYDHVVVDSPPVLGLADAPLISRAVEGCVFVVESEGAPTRAVRTALARLKLINSHIFGVVLTKLRRRESGYGYGEGYGYSYSYGQESADRG